MKRGLLVLTVVLFVFTSVAMAADDEASWSTSIQLMSMNIKGADTKIGSSNEYTDLSNENGWDTSINSKAVNLDFDNNPALMVKVLYHYDVWNLSASGWGFDSDADKSGIADTSIDYDAGHEFIMWDSSFGDYYGNEYYAMDYWSKSGISVRSFDLLTSRELNQSLRADFGVKLLKYRNYAKKGANITEGYSYDFTDEFEEVIGNVQVNDYSRYVSSAEIESDLLTGLTLGMQYEKVLERFSLSASVQQSIVFGKADDDRIWSQSSEVIETDSDQNYFVSESSLAYYTPLEKYITLPITEARADIAYKITNTISLSLGAFTSVWWNTPLAADLSMNSNAFEWNDSKSTLFFYGITGGVTLNF